MISGSFRKLSTENDQKWRKKFHGVIQIIKERLWGHCLEHTVGDDDDELVAVVTLAMELVFVCRLSI